MGILLTEKCDIKRQNWNIQQDREFYYQKSNNIDIKTMKLGVKTMEVVGESTITFSYSQQFNSFQGSWFCNSVTGVLFVILTMFYLLPHQLYSTKICLNETCLNINVLLRTNLNYSFFVFLFIISMYLVYCFSCVA